MAEYTYKDIIIDPTSEEAKNAVGKKCFVSNIPTSCLEHANENDYDFLTKLNSINLNLENPFNVKFNGVEHNFNSIIVNKEEPKPQYVPFKSKEEFIDAFHYHDDANYSETDDILLNYGMWLRFNNDDVICAVTEIWTDGVFIGHDHMKIKWEELFNFYTFMDDSPCGKINGCEGFVITAGKTDKKNQRRKQINKE